MEENQFLKELYNKLGGDPEKYSQFENSMLNDESFRKGLYDKLGGDPTKYDKFESSFISAKTENEIDSIEMKPENLPEQLVGVDDLSPNGYRELAQGMVDQGVGVLDYAGEIYAGQLNPNGEITNIYEEDGNWYADYEVNEVRFGLRGIEGAGRTKERLHLGPDQEFVNRYNEMSPDQRLEAYKKDPEFKNKVWKASAAEYNAKYGITTQKEFETLVEQRTDDYKTVAKIANAQIDKTREKLEAENTVILEQYGEDIYDSIAELDEELNDLSIKKVILKDRGDDTTEVDAEIKAISERYGQMLSQQVIDPETGNYTILANSSAIQRKFQLENQLQEQSLWLNTAYDRSDEKRIQERAELLRASTEQMTDDRGWLYRVNQSLVKSLGGAFPWKKEKAGDEEIYIYGSVAAGLVGAFGGMMQSLTRTPTQPDGAEWAKDITDWAAEQHTYSQNIQGKSDQGPIRRNEIDLNNGLIAVLDDDNNILSIESQSHNNVEAELDELEIFNIEREVRDKVKDPENIKKRGSWGRAGRTVRDTFIEMLPQIVATRGASLAGTGFASYVGKKAVTDTLKKSIAKGAVSASVFTTTLGPNYLDGLSAGLSSEEAYRMALENSFIEATLASLIGGMETRIGLGKARISLPKRTEIRQALIAMAKGEPESYLKMISAFKGIKGFTEEIGGEVIEENLTGILQGYNNARYDIGSGRYTIDDIFETTVATIGATALMSGFTLPGQISRNMFDGTNEFDYRLARAIVESDQDLLTIAESIAGKRGVSKEKVSKTVTGLAQIQEDFQELPEGLSEEHKNRWALTAIRDLNSELNTTDPEKRSQERLENAIRKAMYSDPDFEIPDEKAETGDEQPTTKTNWLTDDKQIESAVNRISEKYGVEIIINENGEFETPKGGRNLRARALAIQELQEARVKPSDNVNLEFYNEEAGKLDTSRDRDLLETLTEDQQEEVGRITNAGDRQTLLYEYAEQNPEGKRLINIYEAEDILRDSTAKPESRIAAERILESDGQFDVAAETARVLEAIQRLGLGTDNVKNPSNEFEADVIEKYGAEQESTEDSQEADPESDYTIDDIEEFVELDEGNFSLVKGTWYNDATRLPVEDPNLIKTLNSEIGNVPKQGTVIEREQGRNLIADGQGGWFYMNKDGTASKIRPRADVVAEAEETMAQTEPESEPEPESDVQFNNPNRTQLQRGEDKIIYEFDGEKWTTNGKPVDETLSQELTDAVTPTGDSAEVTLAGRSHTYLESKDGQWRHINTGKLASPQVMRQINNRSVPKAKTQAVPKKTKADELITQYINALIDRLKLTGLANDVYVLDSNGIQEVLDKIDREKGTVKYTGQGSSVKGFVHNGNVYINSDTVTPDTPIHEFGHLYFDFLKNNNKELFKQGVDLVKAELEKSTDPSIKKIIDYVKETQPDLEGDALVEEVLVQLIGTKGLELTVAAGKGPNTFVDWIKKAWKMIGKALGLTDMPISDIPTLTLEKFTERAAVDLLKGKELKSPDKKKKRSRKNTITAKITIPNKGRLDLIKNTPALSNIFHKNQLDSLKVGDNEVTLNMTMWSKAQRMLGAERVDTKAETARFQKQAEPVSGNRPRFQKTKSISKKDFNKLIGAFKNVFPEYKERGKIIYGENALDKKLKSIGSSLSEFKKDGIKGAENLVSSSGELYGAVFPDGTIWFDDTVINASTPIHEFTHVFNRMIQDANPELWNRIVETAKSTKLWNEIQKDPNYKKQFSGKKGKDLTNSVANEIWAWITGARGEQNKETILNQIRDDRTLWEKFQDTLNQFWGWVKSIFSRTGSTPLETFDGLQLMMKGQLKDDKTLYNLSTKYWNNLGKVVNDAKTITELNGILNNFSDTIYDKYISTRAKISNKRARAQIAQIQLTNPAQMMAITARLGIQYKQDSLDYTEDEIIKLKKPAEDVLTENRKFVGNKWKKALENKTPAERYLVLRSLYQFISKESEAYPVNYLESAFDMTMEAFEQSSNPQNFNWYAEYNKNIIETLSDDPTSAVEVTPENGVHGTWVKMNKASESKNVEETLAKVNAASNNTGWCTRTTGASKVIQQDDHDFYVFFPKNTTQAAIAIVPIKEGEESQLSSNVWYTGVFKLSNASDNSIEPDYYESVSELAKKTKDPDLAHTLEQIGFTGLTREEVKAIKEEKDREKIDWFNSHTGDIFETDQDFTELLENFSVSLIRNGDEVYLHELTEGAIGSFPESIRAELTHKLLRSVDRIELDLDIADVDIPDAGRVKSVGGDLRTGQDQTIELDFVGGRATSNGNSIVTIGTIVDDAYSNDESTLTAETIGGTAYSGDQSTLTAKTIEKSAYSGNQSTLTAKTIEKSAYSGSQSTLTAETIKGLTYSSGESTLTAKTIGESAYSQDQSTLIAETIEGLTSSYHESTLTAETIKGSASSHNNSTLTAKTIEGRVESYDQSSLTTETIEKSVNSYDQSTLTAKTIKGFVTSYDQSTLTAETIEESVDSRNNSTLTAKTIKGFVTSRDKSTLTAETIKGLTDSRGESTLIATTIERSVNSYDQSTLTAETIKESVTSHGNSTLTVKTIKGFATSRDKSTLTAETIEGLTDSHGESTLIAETIEESVTSYAQSTLTAKTIKGFVTTYDQSTLTAETIEKLADSHGESTIRTGETVERAPVFDSNVLFEIPEKYQENMNAVENISIGIPESLQQQEGSGGDLTTLANEALENKSVEELADTTIGEIFGINVPESKPRFQKTKSPSDDLNKKKALEDRKKRAQERAKKARNKKASEINYSAITEKEAQIEKVLRDSKYFKGTPEKVDTQIRTYKTVLRHLAEAFAKRRGISVDDFYKNVLGEVVVKKSKVPGFKGNVTGDKLGRFMVTLIAGQSDVSTPLHEFAHIFEFVLSDAEKNKIAEWVKGSGAKWDGSDELREKFVEGYLAYIAAPRTKKHALNDEFRDFSNVIYKAINGVLDDQMVNGIHQYLTPEMEKLYSEMTKGMFPATTKKDFKDMYKSMDERRDKEEKEERIFAQKYLNKLLEKLQRDFPIKRNEDGSVKLQPYISDIELDARASRHEFVQDITGAVATAKQILYELAIGDRSPAAERILGATTPIDYRAFELAYVVLRNQIDSFQTDLDRPYRKEGGIVGKMLKINEQKKRGKRRFSPEELQAMESYEELSQLRTTEAEYIAVLKFLSSRSGQNLRISGLNPMTKESQVIAEYTARNGGVEPDEKTRKELIDLHNKKWETEGKIKSELNKEDRTIQEQEELEKEHIMRNVQSYVHIKDKIEELKKQRDNRSFFKKKIDQIKDQISKVKKGFNADSKIQSLLDKYETAYKDKDNAALYSAIKQLVAVVYADPTIPDPETFEQLHESVHQLDNRITQGELFSALLNSDPKKQKKAADDARRLKYLVQKEVNLLEELEAHVKESTLKDIPDKYERKYVTDQVNALQKYVDQINYMASLSDITGSGMVALQQKLDILAQLYTDLHIQEGDVNLTYDDIKNGIGQKAELVIEAIREVRKEHNKRNLENKLKGLEEVISELDAGTYQGDIAFMYFNSQQDVVDQMLSDPALKAQITGEKELESLIEAHQNNENINSVINALNTTLSRLNYKDIQTYEEIVAEIKKVLKQHGHGNISEAFILNAIYNRTKPSRIINEATEHAKLIRQQGQKLAKFVELLEENWQREAGMANGSKPQQTKAARKMAQLSQLIRDIGELSAIQYERSPMLEAYYKDLQASLSAMQALYNKHLTDPQSNIELDRVLDLARKSKAAKDIRRYERMREQAAADIQALKNKNKNNTWTSFDEFKALKAIPGFMVRSFSEETVELREKALADRRESRALLKNKALKIMKDRIKEEEKIFQAAKKKDPNVTIKSMSDQLQVLNYYRRLIENDSAREENNERLIRLMKENQEINAKLKQKYANIKRGPFGRGLTEFLNTPRLLTLAADLSFILYQGGMAIPWMMHPSNWKASRNLFANNVFGGLGNEIAGLVGKGDDSWYVKIEAKMKSHPRYTEAVQNGLQLIDENTISLEDELNLQTLLERIPFIKKYAGRLRKFSERMYISYMNQLRFDMYLYGRERLTIPNSDIDNAEAMETWAEHINTLTGSMRRFSSDESTNKSINDFVKGAAGIVISPRLYASNIKTSVRMMRDPFYLGYLRLRGRTIDKSEITNEEEYRKYAMQEAMRHHSLNALAYAGFVGAIGSLSLMTTYAALSGIDDEEERWEAAVNHTLAGTLNPFSTNFLKLQLGQRIYTFSPIAAYFRFTAKVMGSIASELVPGLTGWLPYNEYDSMKFEEMIGDFLRYKANPVFGSLNTVLWNLDFKGDAVADTKLGQLGVGLTQFGLPISGQSVTENLRRELLNNDDPVIGVKRGLSLGFIEGIIDFTGVSSYTSNPWYDNSVSSYTRDKSFRLRYYIGKDYDNEHLKDTYTGVRIREQIQNDMGEYILNGIKNGRPPSKEQMSDHLKKVARDAFKKYDEEVPSTVQYKYGD